LAQVFEPKVESHGVTNRVHDVESPKMAEQPQADDSSGDEDVEQTFDRDVLAQSIEELTLHSEIRAIEIQAGLEALQRQLAMQELLVQQWEAEFRKEKKNLPAGAAADLQRAQESVMVLRQRCRKLEEARPLQPPERPPGGNAAAEPAIPSVQAETAVEEKPSTPDARAPSTKTAVRQERVNSKQVDQQHPPWVPPKRQAPLPKPPGAASAAAAAKNPADSAVGNNPVEMARRSAARASGSKARAASGSASRRGGGYPGDADSESGATSRRRP